MNIVCGKGLTIQSGAAVNKIGKYLYKHLDGAYKFTHSPNMCDVYFLVLYQLPREKQIPGKQKEGYNDMHEMHVDLNITTYQNKIRVNLIEITEDERTIGYDLYKPELIQTDIEAAKEKIYQKVCKRLEKAYEEYDFIF